MKILYWLNLDSNRLLDTKIVFDGLDVGPERFCEVATRGGVTLYVASLTDEEINQAEEVKTLQELLLTEETDWSTIGMILNGISFNGTG